MSCKGPVEVVYEPFAHYLQRLGVGNVRAVLLASGFMRYDGVEMVAEALGGFKNAVELKAVFKEATPKAYRRLKEWGFDVRASERLHAKFYLFVFEEEYVAVVGSSNLSTRGLVTNREVNVVIRGSVGDPFYKCLRAVFDVLWAESRAPTPGDLRRVFVKRAARAKSLLAEVEEALRRILGVEVEPGADRRETIPIVYKALARFRERAEEAGLVEEEYVRRYVAEMYGGLERLGELVAGLCKKAPGAYLLDVPCLLVYAAYEAVQEARRQGVVFQTGVDFYRAALKKAANLAERAGGAVRQLVYDELQALDNDREYRQQVVERKIGAAILPLVLALPQGCRVDFEKIGGRRVRKIVCT
ncbi:MAG: phospholipase D-like domain-containing protein [Thermofilaceae archaeon]